LRSAQRDANGLRAGGGAARSLPTCRGDGSMKRTNAPVEMTRFFSLAAWCLVGFSLHIVSSGLQAQTGGLPTPQGTDIFRRLVHGAGVSPLKNATDIQNDPEKKLLIILGETDVLDGLP